ncbi:MAG: hypothetical protein K2J33_02945, partial [Alistipes sp.]|nr:hypothetical protein [Alistipes sp.]
IIRTRRQCSNKSGITLAYSYFGYRLRYCASEKMQASLLFSIGLFVSLAIVEDTRARQNTSLLAFALTYSYLWLSP